MANEQIIKHKTLELIDEHIGLDPDEQVLLMTRMHWVIFRNALVVALFIPFVIFSVLLLIKLAGLPLSEQVMQALIWGGSILALICFLAGGARFLWHYHMWHHTFYVMTNKRLAIITRHKPWSYQVQQINLNNINDVTLQREGFEAFMYGYSDIIAVTFSGTHFTLEQVGDAAKVQRAIMQQLALQDRPSFSLNKQSEQPIEEPA
jgi:hypothetical protein